MFPGLCLPDNPDRAMQLLVPEGGGKRGGDSKDVRAAKDALDEVSVVVNSWSFLTIVHEPMCMKAHWNQAWCT